ncbi:LysR family transcriptional regulator [Raoultibacter phocaeensis]|uniref:LysR family transcriptional regulator n=1 Tax=Raoultibacter phocaeensis TaxID=2479841 RepID=UPI00111B6146|nr:LysR family transcriptional regulator [Raoultibacter phocaeensis]
MKDQKYEAFIKVAEAGSFKRAAEELGYTQAGISYMINALEKEFGLPLFVREYGGTRLTAEGEALLPWVHGVRTSERQLASRLDELKHLEGGSVRIATFTSTSIHWLPGIAKRFQEIHPAINLEFISNDNQSEVEDMVWSGDADCGFFALPVARELATVSLRHDPMLIVLPEDHPEANAAFFSKEAMATYPCIKIDNGVYTEMDEVYRVNGVEPHIAYSIDNDYAALAMVAEGLGYCVFPELILREPLFDVVCKHPEVPTSRELAIAVRSFENASTATKAFVACTQAWVGDAYSRSDSASPKGPLRDEGMRPSARSSANTR